MVRETVAVETRASRATSPRRVGDLAVRGRARATLVLARKVDM
jgi:hypothetical protein